MTLPISILQGKRCKQESRGRKARAGWKVKAGPSRCRRVHPAVSLSISSVLSSRCDPTPSGWASQDVHNSTEGHTHSLAGRRCCQWRWRAVEQIPKWRDEPIYETFLLEEIRAPPFMVDVELDIAMGDAYFETAGVRGKGTSTHFSLRRSLLTPL